MSIPDHSLIGRRGREGFLEQRRCSLDSRHSRVTPHGSQGVGLRGLVSSVQIAATCRASETDLIGVTRKCRRGYPSLIRHLGCLPTCFDSQE